MKGRELSRQQARGFRLDQAWDDLDRLIRQHVPDIAMLRTAGSLTNGVDRTYHWTRASALRAIDDGGWGTTTYDCDANGQVVQARFGDGGFERYVYDAALKRRRLRRPRSGRPCDDGRGMGRGPGRLVDHAGRPRRQGARTARRRRRYGS